MELTKVTEKITDSQVRFIFWVYCRDEFERRDRPYDFKWDGKSVIFMFGGWKGRPRIVGEAGSKEEARRVAEEWLEGWLRGCGVL
jgi:hypothetical protein